MTREYANGVRWYEGCKNWRSELVSYAEWETTETIYSSNETAYTDGSIIENYKYVYIGIK